MAEFSTGATFRCFDSLLRRVPDFASCCHSPAVCVIDQLHAHARSSRARASKDARGSAASLALNQSRRLSLSPVASAAGPVGHAAGYCTTAGSLIESEPLALCQEGKCKEFVSSHRARSYGNIVSGKAIFSSAIGRTFLLRSPL